MQLPQSFLRKRRAAMHNIENAATVDSATGTIHLILSCAQQELCVFEHTVQCKPKKHTPPPCTWLRLLIATPLLLPSTEEKHASLCCAA
jgi:hypothetical protein